MKNKKLVSLFLALAMVFAMAVPAFASGNTNTSSTQTTTISGETKKYEVDITVGSTGSVIANPYKISFTPTGADEPTSDQIINAGTFITNNTNIPLKCTAKVKATPASTVTLLDAVAKVNAKYGTGTTSDYDGKGVFLTFEILKCDDNETEPKWTDAKSITTWTTPQGTAAPATSTILTATDQTLTDCLKFAAVGEDEDPNYACFHISGYMNVYPKKVESSNLVNDEWTKDDTIGAVVVLTFLPDVDASAIT